MKDSKRKTIIEVLSGKVVSFIVGYFVNMLVLPMVGVPYDSHETFLTISFLFVSIAAFRSYVWRRLFNRLDIFK